MTAFVDASVLVAMLLGELDAAIQTARLEDTDDLITSPVAIWEAVTALIRRDFSPEAAREEVMSLLDAARVRIVPIDARSSDFALQAYALYGKGLHAANLNMGDCFAYACAKANSAQLFYKGADFAHTDLA